MHKGDEQINNTWTREIQKGMRENGNKEQKREGQGEESQAFGEIITASSQRNLIDV